MLKKEHTEGTPARLQVLLAQELEANAFCKLV